MNKDKLYHELMLESERYRNRNIEDSIHISRVEKINLPDYNNNVQDFIDVIFKSIEDVLLDKKRARISNSFTLGLEKALKILKENKAIIDNNTLFARYTDHVLLPFEVSAGVEVNFIDLSKLDIRRAFPNTYSASLVSFAVTRDNVLMIPHESKFRRDDLRPLLKDGNTYLFVTLEPGIQYTKRPNGRINLFAGTGSYFVMEPSVDIDGDGLPFLYHEDILDEEKYRDGNNNESSHKVYNCIKSFHNSIDALEFVSDAIDRIYTECREEEEEEETVYFE